MTLKEWAELPDDVPGELVDGVLVEEEMASLPHEVVVLFLLRLFGPIDDRGGLVIPSEYKYGVAPRRGRKPDISVYLPGTPQPASRLGTTPPDLAVEVITASPRDARRDRVEKMAEYARFGIRWYWLVDPALRIVELYELGPKKRYTLAASSSSGKVAVPTCRGLKLDLDKLWARVDRLA
ncbi:MAG: Uma2 family endonuclease [Myxococcaceae bacterium]|nr:Uma2 family endonuclease [Myxococcaceae bacterium]